MRGNITYKAMALFYGDSERRESTEPSTEGSQVALHYCGSTTVTMYNFAQAICSP